MASRISRIHEFEEIEPFVVFQKKKFSKDARLLNMGGCSYNLVHFCMFDGEMIWRERPRKEYEMRSHYAGYSQCI